MSLKNKIYGAVETENHIVFTGFCKDLTNEEKQEVDVFIDGKKVDTILADKSIKEIEDKYEVYEASDSCFSYTVPEEYIGLRHKLEFKDTNKKEISNSPNFTLDKSHEKYNELLFDHSLCSYPNNKTTEKNTSEIAFFTNTTNLSFFNYLKKIKQLNPDISITALCFNLKEQKLAETMHNDFHIKTINHINDITNNFGLLVWENSQREFIFKFISKIINKNLIHSKFIEEDQSLTLKKNENENTTLMYISNNLEEFKLNTNDFNIANNSVYIMINNYAKKYINIEKWEEIKIDDTMNYFYNFVIIKYLLNSLEFKHFYFNLFYSKHNKVSK